MSSIDKLLIRGIRSFDPQEQHVIHFYTPLTIIVGHNGSGKTTIIECLKYATTGDLPPNSKQGAFIHDPKVANETEVKAQVRLKFRNVNGKLMVCTRSMQLTQKAKQVQQKTLEAVLETKDPVTGERISLSTRCADLDAEMPIHLGVSKAILDNVIFCHQEESNWPLAEPSVLKKKFDDIFASTRYTKALDSIRSLKKEKAHELLVDQGYLKQKEDRKARADLLAQQRIATDARIAAHTAKLETLGAQLTEVTAQITQLIDHVARGRALHNELAATTQAREQLLSFMNDLKRNMVEIQGNPSDEDLMAALAEYKARVQAQSRDRVQLVQAKELRGVELDGLKDRMQRKLLDKGRAESEVAQLTALLAERDALVQALAEALALDPGRVPPANRFGELLHARIAQAQAALDRLRRDSAARQQLLDQQLKDAGNDLAVTQAKRTSMLDTIEANGTKHNQYQVQIAQMSREEVEIAKVTEMFEATKAALADKQALLQRLTTEGKYARLKLDLEHMDVQSRSLQDELAQISRDSGVRVQLENRDRDLAKAKEQIAALADTLAAVCQRHNLPVPRREETPKHLDTILANQLRTKQHLHKLRTDDVADLTKRLQDVETRLKMSAAERNKWETMITERTRELSGYLNPTYPSLDECLAAIEKEIEKDEQELGLQKSLSMVIDRLRTFSIESHVCALCQRGLHDEDELQELLRTANNFVRRVPEKVPELERKLAANRNQLEYTQRARPIVLQIEQAKKQLNELPPLTLLENDRTKYTDQLETSQREAASLAREIDGLQAALEVVRDMVRVQATADELDRECSAMRAELAYTPMRSMDEVQRAMRDLHAQREATTRDLDAEQMQRQQAQQEVAARQTQLAHLQRQLVDKQAMISKREALREGSIELQAENERLRAQVDQLAEVVSNTKQRVEDLYAQLATQKADDDAKIDAALKEGSMLKSQSDRFADLAAKIDQIENRNPSQTIKMLEVELGNLQENMISVEAEIATTEAQIQEIQRSLSEETNHERNINDNISFRQKQRELAALEAKAQELQAEIADHDQHSYSAQVAKLRKQQNDLVTEQAKLQGECTQLEVNQRNIQSELEGEYKNANAEFQEMKYKVATTELAVSDLEKYAQALDKAIMQYHTVKMEEINKIIRELWVNTYQGNDIDTIEIRSDKESTRGNRQFSYRLVMIKGDRELEMRGRCSAGQKVLASLVIRLALAETFCLHCGILALDEPTTNLDQDNIESLAESLARVIKARRQQANFQLLVITHDEAFLEQLGRSGYADYYWRVYKDENQHSCIERLPISHG
ncbi:DNA repair protein rad50 [Allomyces arbusculus]|nr:DNA repair protein rad50 [Allomyces arbusculus]